MEERALVRQWLNRVEACVGNDRIFQDALRLAHLPGAGLEDEFGVTHAHLRAVTRYVRTFVPDITLRVFSQAELLDLGVLGYALASAVTLEEAIEMSIRHHDLTSDSFQAACVFSGDWVCVRPVLKPGCDDDLIAISEDYVMGTWRLLHLLLGPNIDPLRAEANFAYGAPDHADSYERHFDCRVFFGAAQTELRFPRPWLRRRVVTGNRAITAICRDACKHLVSRGNDGFGNVFPDTVRRLLLSRSGGRILRLDAAADELDMSPAQLRKRLYRAGTSYKELVLSVRMELARNYLGATNLPLQEIADRLDYSQPAPFSRAFKKKHGLSPQQWRSRHVRIPAHRAEAMDATA